MVSEPLILDKISTAGHLITPFFQLELEFITWYFLYMDIFDGNTYEHFIFS